MRASLGTKKGADGVEMGEMKFLVVEPKNSFREKYQKSGREAGRGPLKLVMEKKLEKALCSSILFPRLASLAVDCVF